VRKGFRFSFVPLYGPTWSSWWKPGPGLMLELMVVAPLE
jgi:hypothetical protein